MRDLLAAPETMGVLREELAAVAEGLGLEDLDLSAVTGPRGHLTQEAARYVYGMTERAGACAAETVYPTQGLIRQTEFFRAEGNF